MSDLISREDAIANVALEIWHYPNELYTSLNCFENCQELAELALNRLPSVQPELANNSPKVDNKNGELISRQDAIDAIEKVHWYHQNDNGEMVRGANSHKHQPWYKSQDVYDALEKLPSVQPRKGKGKWIDHYMDEGYVECPFCHSATNCDGNKDELHYCFSCGAELRGDDDVPESIT